MNKLFVPIILITTSFVLTMGVLTVKSKIVSSIEAIQKELSIKKVAEKKAHIEADERMLEINNKNNANARYNQGLIYSDNKEYDKAIIEFKKAIELNPDFDKPYSNLGIAYSYLEKRDLALEYYEKAIEINPNYARAYNNIGALYIVMGYEDSFNIEKYRKAKPYLEKAIDLDPIDYIAYYNLGRVYYLFAWKGEPQYYNDAEYNLLKAIEFKYDYYHAHRQLGFVYFDQNESEKAFKEWEIAFSLGMEDEEVEQIIENVKSKN